VVGTDGLWGDLTKDSEAAGRGRGRVVWDLSNGGKGRRWRRGILGKVDGSPWWNATLLVGIAITSNGSRRGGCNRDMAKISSCGGKSRSGTMRKDRINVEITHDAIRNREDVELRWSHTKRHVRCNTPQWIEDRREGNDDQEELLEVREPLTDLDPSIFIGDLVLGRKGDVRIGRRKVSENGRRTRRQEGRNEKDGEGNDGGLTWILIINQFHWLMNSSLEEASLRRVIALARRVNSVRRSMKVAMVEVLGGKNFWWKVSLSPAATSIYIF
jgi:hypothetical protein